jgi:hypothetical protein
MFADLTSACSMIVSLVLPLQAYRIAAVPLSAEPAVKLWAIHGFLHTVNRSFDFVMPSCHHE